MPERTPESLTLLGAQGQAPAAPVRLGNPMALPAFEVYRDAVGRGDGGIRPEVARTSVVPSGFRLSDDADAHEVLDLLAVVPRHEERVRVS